MAGCRRLHFEPALNPWCWLALTGPAGTAAHGFAWSIPPTTSQPFTGDCRRRTSCAGRRKVIRWCRTWAKAWEISPDFRVFTFELRRGMRWSDGHPLTADDIVFWYEHEVRYVNAQPKFLRAGPSLGTVTNVDDLRVRFEFSQPNPLFL